MTSKNDSRGFDQLLNEKIIKIDTTAINCVTVYTESRKVICINTDDAHYSIPVVAANLVK